MTLSGGAIFDSGRGAIIFFSGLFLGLLVIVGGNANLPFDIVGRPVSISKSVPDRVAHGVKLRLERATGVSYPYLNICIPIKFGRKLHPGC